jgi:hypothetical protein
VSKLEIRERPPSTLENFDGGPLGGADRDPGAPTINVTNIDGGLPWRCRSWKFGAPAINAKKCRQRPLSEVPELKIRERSPSTLENVDGAPLGGADGDPGASTINVTNVDGGLPRRCRS